MPVDGAAMLPVRTGAGLMPGDGSSVAPRPIPNGDSGDPVPLASGEVAPTVGVGTAIPVTCASAPPPAKKARQAATRQYLTGGLHCGRSVCIESVDGGMHALAVLHENRLTTFPGGYRSSSGQQKDPLKQVHSLSSAGQLNALKQMLSFASADR